MHNGFIGWYGCACAGIFFSFSSRFTIHNSFSCWKYMRDIGKWIFDIYIFWLVLAIVCFFFARIQLNFAWTFCGSISMKRYKCIECITRFSVCFHWQTWNEWLKWVNNNWMLESTTPMITTINKQSGVFQWLRSNRNTYTLLTSTSSLFFS